MSAEVGFPNMPEADAGEFRRRGLTATRGAALAAAVVLMGLLSGDGHAVAVLNGIDPLDILNLKVRPNVIVVLDTSGSMTSTVDAASLSMRSGDHPRSKMRQAKEVLQTVVQANQTKVSFLYGQYTQDNVTLRNPLAGADRFRYTTDGFNYPSMLTTELQVLREPGQTALRGLQSWQDIRARWNTLYFGEALSVTTVTPPQLTVSAANNRFYFNERTVTSPVRYYACVITLAGADLRTYTGDPDMSALAALITAKMVPGYGGGDRVCTAMNGATGGLTNTLTLSWNAGASLFNMSRAGTRGWQAMMNGVAGPLLPTLGYTDDIPTNAASGGGGANWSTAAGPLNANNTVGGSSTTTSTVVCGATVTAQFYRNGADLATALQIAMNTALNTPACSGDRVAGGTPNSYTVTYTPASGSFAFARTAVSTRQFQIRWADTPNSIRGALGSPAAANTALGTGSVSSGNSYTMMLRNNTTWEFNETYDPDGSTGPALSQSVTHFNMRAGRLFNGETISVQSDGTICDMTFGAATSPASFFLQEVSAGCGTSVGTPVKFGWAGGDHAGNTISCNGFMQKVALIPCDLDSPPAPTQFTTIFPFIDLEFNFNADGTAKGSYVESQDGAFSATSIPLDTEGGGKADGATPIGNSLRDLKPIFTGLWNTGQAGSTSAASPPPYQLDPISGHLNPKEKTIVLFVTDGDDTCNSFGGDNSLRAAYKAQQLYTPIVATEPASSVQTFVIGFGGAFSGGVPTRLNWIAWGGSGMTAGAPYSFGITGDGWNAIPTPGDRAKCTTCQDALVAPDGETLRRQLQAIIDQGASSGEFSAAGGGAAASIIDSIYEYVDQAATVPGKDPFDARNPVNRFGALTPIRALATFALPGFRGQLKAYQNDGAGVAIQKWSAGDVLFNSVANGMLTCPVTGNGPTGGNSTPGQCTFSQLSGNAEDFNIASSSAAIKRRIYTTSQNGYFGVGVSNLISTPPTAPFRVSIWPPQSASLTTVVAPRPSYTAPGLFDREMGLPLDSTTTAATDFTNLQTRFKACSGLNLPANCGSATPLTQMQAARREAREMMLAFLAGAQPDLDSNGNPLRVQGGANAGQILYKVRSWVLSESTLATSAIAGPPLQNEPEIFKPEYALYRDGIRDTSGKNPDTTGAQIKQGFGLRNPDKDNTAVPGVTPNDTRTALKPVMTMVFMGANDGLHAFRGGPNCSPSGSACAEVGGEELYAFVPYDQLVKLQDRYRDEPQSRANKTYMVASSLRYSDVFVPGPVTSPSIGGTTGPDIQGVWRRILYFGRGIGGKYLTALDVTAPGAYTERALLTTGPIPLWSRGNPDTTNGLFGGPAVNAPDLPKYATMGETWSVPAVAYVDTTTSRASASGVNFVLYAGSGFGGVGEGTTFYTLDSLTGDVVASANVETAAASAGLTRAASDLTFTRDDGSIGTITNAIVANPITYNPGRYAPLTSPHPAGFKSTRVYVGDLHGRFWKFLAALPGVAIPAADLGVRQPAATAASLIGLPPADTAQKAHVWVSTGNDLRRSGPFAFFGFRDDGLDGDTATTGTVNLACFNCAQSVTGFTPMVPLLMREFDQGPVPAGATGLVEARFRGDIQPATAFECATVNATTGKCEGATLGRVFIGASRLNLPNTAFAPPTPFKFGSGQYPCRSSFDSILYALGAATGLSAYDLNASGDDAYAIFTDSRLGGVAVIADPDPGRGGSQVNKEEGKVGGPVQPPPPPGIPPSSSTASASVVMQASPGRPYPAMKFGSTVCQ